LLEQESKIFSVDTNEEVLEMITDSTKPVMEKIRADFVSDKLKFPNLHGIMMSNSLQFVKDKINFISKMKTI